MPNLFLAFLVVSSYDEYLTIERENLRLRRERANSIVEARIYKTKLEAYQKLEGEYNSDDDNAEHNSELENRDSIDSSSLCSGFSDICGPDGADGARWVAGPNLSLETCYRIGLETNMSNAGSHVSWNMLISLA